MKQTLLEIHHQSVCPKLLASYFSHTARAGEGKHPLQDIKWVHTQQARRWVHVM